MDNTQLNGGQGGDVIRDISKSGVKTQVVTLDLGGAGAEQLVSGTLPSQQYYLDSETGLVSTVKGVNNAAASIDYLDLIGTGAIPGYSLFRGWGQRMGTSTSVIGDDVWEGVATNIPLPNQTVGEQMTLVSTSALDGVSGTGILTVDIHYLDVAGNPQSEIVTMNGVTPVNTVATNIRFVQAIHANSVGTNGFSVGAITIYKLATPATIYNEISIGNNLSLSSARMIPLGKTFYLKGISFCGSSGKSLSVRLKATSTFEDVLLPGVFLQKLACFLLNSTCVKSFPIPLKFPALCILKCTVYSAQAGGDIATSYDGWTE